MRRLTLVVMISLVAVICWGRPQSRYVHTDTICNASQAALQALADRMAYEFQTDPDLLFDWAFKGTGDQNTGKEKDAIILRYKERKYDADKKEGDVAIDIYVLGARMFKDNHLITRYHQKEKLKGGKTQSRIYATYTGSLLEEGEMLLRFDSIAPEKTAIHYEFNITFGKFFSAFVSDKRWKQVAEWRLKKIIANVVEYAETGKVEDKEDDLPAQGGKK